MFRITAILTFCLLSTAVFAQSDEEVAAARLAYIAGDFSQVDTVLRPAAEAGNPIAQNIMAVIYDKGLGVESDLDTAIMWYERAAAQNYAKAYHNLGIVFRDGRPGQDPDYARAISNYESAIALGYAASMNDRARMHEEGRGGDVDQEAANALFTQAVDLNHALAMNNLGLNYVRGIGVEKDLVQALELFKRSATLGEVRAISNLGAMYGNGYGVPQDDIAAMGLYMMAAQQRHGRAAINLAYDLIEGTEGLRDPARGWAYCVAAPNWAEPSEDYTEDCDYLGSLISDEVKARGVEIAAGFTQ